MFNVFAMYIIKYCGEIVFIVKYFLQYNERGKQHALQVFNRR